VTHSPIRLRRLEVQGFKSFASRTAFEFGPGITAIVGPNGSGKSNLADALRWVLGEQNPRAMRLRRLEDAIFAGGGKRAQAGFAEVSLVLDNSEGWLPLDFEEVVVTRRLHRSGESEYLLNRQRVRLRDILDLFLKARLGQNSYAILGQGMVDAILSLRPEERRTLIEEAADVRRHRLKIDEAVDQLAATRENRDRIELLVAEIGPRLAQLEGQARRAVQHAQLSHELADQLKLLYGRRVRAAQIGLQSAKRQCDAATTEASLATTVLAEAEERLQRHSDAAEGANAELRQVEARWRELREQQLESERSLRDAAERLPQLEARRLELDGDLVALELESEELGAELPESATAENAFEHAEKAIAEAEYGLRFAIEESERRRAELEECENAARAAQARSVLARDRLARRQALLERLRGEEQHLDQRHRAALAGLKAWAFGYLDLEVRAREQERRVHMALTLAGDARRRAQVAASHRSASDSALADLATRIEQIKLRLDLLTSEQEAHRPAEDIVVALLDALRGGGPGRPRILGILGGLVHVQRGFEIAIEAALAESLNGLVVRTEQEALMAVDVLQQIDAGRLSFFVLEGTRGSHPLNIATGGGVLGVATQYIHCDSDYRELVDALLGRMVVVEDIEAAHRVTRRGLGSAVTLDGTVLRGSGLISGGHGKSEGAVFRLDAELGELERELKTLESQHAETHVHALHMREQADGAEERLIAAERSLSEVEQQRDSAQHALMELRRKLPRLRADLESVRARRTELESQRGSLAADPDDGAEATTHDAGEYEQALLRARDVLASARADEASWSAKLYEARGHQAALNAERASIEALHRNRVEARERTIRLISGRRAALQVIATERSQTEATIEMLTAALRGSEQAARAASDALGEARARVGSLSQAQKALLESVRAGRAGSASLDRARLDAELALARAEEKWDRLQEELQTEGIPIDATAADGAEAENATSAAIHELETRIRALRRQIREIGAINEEAPVDYRELKERHDFLTGQIADLEGAESTLMQALEQLRQIVREQFRSTYQAVNADFQVYFRLFFGGGQARLALAEPEDYGESGVDIIAQPPGKRLQNLAMLSGGERSMTAVALLFALLESNPAPFCVFDEVDAALDEANVGRFSEALARLAGRSQFLIITHNRGTVQAADQIYGISMTADGVSNVLSMRLSDAAPLLA
jgi:chromosome segregation protein